MEKVETLLSKVAVRIFYGLLAYIPLHILISTWAGTSLDLLEEAKVLKDIVLVAGFACALFVSLRQPWFKALLKSKLMWLIGAYALITLLLAAIKPTHQEAETLAVVYNLRFLLFFVYAVLLAHLYDVRHLRRRALQIVVGIGVLVALFGVVQYTILPDDALSNIGFKRENGVLPAFHIDDKPDLERVMSTIRDPNSLGSYLIIIGSLIGALWLVANKNRKQLLQGSLMITMLCLLLTFSRSAWVGAVVAAIVFAGLYLARKHDPRSLLRAHKRAAIGVAVAVAVLALGLVGARDTYFVQNVIFHADESTTLETPNEKRLRFLDESVDDISQEPLGYGPGTAGIVSIRNDEQGTVLNENYYLQIAHEVGVVGLGLFLAIIGYVATLLYRMYRKDKDIVALALLASFAGLAFTNLLLHIWSSEAVAYTWWGLAGLYMLKRAE
jgi:hypothetical protein